MADCAELFGIAIKQINCPASLLGPLANSSNYYSASQVEESIKQDDTQFEEEYIFLNPNAKLSKYTTKQWKSSKNGLDSVGKAYLQCFFRVQFYVDSYLFITDRIARHHYYLQLRQNVINFNLANLTLERAFLLTSLALQAEKGNYNERRSPSSKSSILNSTFINNENLNQLNQLNELGKCYFDPYDYMPKWIVYQMGESYICENMPTMHKEQHGISRMDAEIMFIKEASEICPHNLHMYRLFKSNPSSSFNKKLNNVNSHFNAFFHGHHFNSSINSNSSYSSTMTNHSSTVSNSNASNLSSNSSTSNLNNKESKVWLAISATGVQLFEQDKQVFINKSNNSSFLDLNAQHQSMNVDRELQSESSTVCYLRSKLSTFIWHDIEKLFFDKKKFEIRSNGYPTRKFTYYTHSDEMAKNLLWLCKMSHRFQLFIQPKLKEMKKRESELSRRKYRESYIYSDSDKATNEDNKQLKLKIGNLMMEYQEPSSSNKYSFLNKPDDASLSASRNTLVGKESLNLSQNQDYHLKPLSDEMKPIMDKFDKQISKLQFSQLEHSNLIDLTASNNLSMNDSTSYSIKLDKLEQSTDHVDFMSGLTDLQKFNQLNTNPFLDKSNYNQINFQLFQQPQQNFDEFVIEHKEDYGTDSYLNNKLTVQPQPVKQTTASEQSAESPKQFEQNANSLKIELNENLNDSFHLKNDVKPDKQTFSLESLTCSGLSEPSSSGISDEFSSSSDRKSGSLCSPPNNDHPLLSHLNHLNNESPNSMQSRCSSNTSYSSDSALGKCSKKPNQTSKLPVPTQKTAKYDKKLDCVQKLKQYAYSVNDLHKKENYFSTINNNHLLEDYNRDLNENETNSHLENARNQIPKPRARKSKFELKNKNKLNAIQYKSLPNVNDFSGGNNRFGRLNVHPNEDQIEKERFNFLNRSDKSTSSEQSVSTIKSNNKTNSSTKLDEEQNYRQNNSFGDSSSNQHWMHSIQENKQNLDAMKNRVHIYENLPSFQNSINNLLNGNKTPTTCSFLPAPNLITTTPNRIATKIGVSSLNRCNKLGSNHNSAHKNPNLRLNLFSTNLDKSNLRTCSYQLLNNENRSTINSPNQTATPFKTTRASSDPGVITYSSTSNLMKIQSKDSFVFYQNSPPLNNMQSSQLMKPKTTLNYDYQTNLKSSSPLNNPIYHRSLNNIAGGDENNRVNNNNLAYDQPLTNQIDNQRKASIRKNQDFHPLRLAESEMTLVSRMTDYCADSFMNQITLPPPPQFSNYQNYKQKATSEQQLNTIEPTHFADKLNQRNRQTDSIDNLQQLKQKSHDLNLPLITALFNDKSLMVPKTVPNCSRQKHQRSKKRYSWHLENNSASNFVNPSSSSTNEPKPCQQTNLDEPTIFDESSTSNIAKYDNNYNNLESNNLNKVPQSRRSDFIDKIWADHLLN